MQLLRSQKRTDLEFFRVLRVLGKCMKQEQLEKEQLEKEKLEKKPLSSV